jgi:metal-responsive CopG/Arc/MetJ family transcriptional regulator
MREGSMGSISRFTVSVPTELLQTFDQKLVNGKESRSAVVRRLLEQALRDIQEQEDIARYVRGYRECPQTEEEFGWADVVAPQALAEVPWE